jgi:hypothetical protein
MEFSQTTAIHIIRLRHLHLIIFPVPIPHLARHTVRWQLKRLIKFTLAAQEAN